METFFSFLEKNLDWLQIMQFTDIAKVLSQDVAAEVEFDLFARLDEHNGMFYVSRFWDSFPEQDRTLGRKSDVYLRSFGNVHFSDLTLFPVYLEATNHYRNARFAKQIFALFEDLRIESRCIQKRPGMRLVFQKRQELYRKIFEQKLNAAINHDYALDKLLYQIYLYVTDSSNLIDFPNDIESLRSIRNRIFEAKSTSDILNYCLSIMAEIEQKYRQDCQEQFFGITSQSAAYVTFDDLRRRDDVASSRDKKQDNENTEGSNEKMMTWHQDTASSEQTLLRFDVEEGTNTDVVGDDIRMSDSNDQVFASIQGNSIQTNKRSYDIQQVKEKRLALENGEETEAGNTENGAKAIHLEPFIPNHRDWNLYQQMASSLAGQQAALVKTFEKNIEQKRNEQRTNLLKGRLGKRLIPLIVEELPRPFYKKQQESKQKDAVFSLLVDCSSSMSTKMNKVKEAIILFHETLRALRIPHDVTGFWEESSAIKKGVSNNYFQPVISFENCEKQLVGSCIMQMEPKEDNRDGFAIREVTSVLKKRTEKQKFLLVFSDGEPSAANYGEDGALDTYEAVSEARKNGVHVIGIFLSNKEVTEQDFDMMKMLYGNTYVALHDMNYLADSIATLLRRLLLS